ncbi:restriction endonuclease subunit S [Pseudomonas sp. ME-P-057]|uniref:restriction endonuclease subunit S n=1 Tax=Pseudomonas sp. ME-P-057 TaxID=3040321 RepID=UPI0025559B98|nr:restriction endonuclease subunit S [Pseudomonas sp. ME-P-057]
MSELPATWLAVTLGDVINYADNVTVEPQDMEPSALLIELEDIERHTSKLLDRQTVEARSPKSSKNRFLKGQVLYGKLRPYLNKVIRADQDGYCSGEIIAISPGLLDRDYLFYALKSPEFLGYVEAVSHGMRMPRLGSQQAKAARFILPPLAEQTRIALKLDELLAQVESVKSRIDSIPALLKRFRQSVLAAAVSGRLTEEWRADNSTCTSHTQLSNLQTGKNTPPGGSSLPISWALKNASEVCGFITKGTTPPKEKMSANPNEVPYIKVYNLTFTGALDFSVDPTFVDADTHSIYLKRSIVKPGDVLMNIVGPPLGKVSIVPDTYPEWNINQAIARFRAGDGISSGYLALCLRTESVLTHAISRAKATAGQFNLTLEICRDLPIPVPPEAEQTEIVRRVEQVFAFADQLEAKVASAKSRIDHLTQSILGKAFRGKLVPQVSDDEPATELLARIQAQRAAAPKANRGRNNI